MTVPWLEDRDRWRVGGVFTLTSGRGGIGGQRRSFIDKGQGLASLSLDVTLVIAHDWQV